jgi:hypothetical protein
MVTCYVFNNFDFLVAKQLYKPLMSVCLSFCHAFLDKMDINDMMDIVDMVDMVDMVDFVDMVDMIGIEDYDEISVFTGKARAI